MNSKRKGNAGELEFLHLLEGLLNVSLSRIASSPLDGHSIAYWHKYIHRRYIRICLRKIG